MKGIWIIIILLAIVAGSITTMTMVSAQKGGVGDNLIVEALNNIATAISGINPNVNVDPTPVNINVDPASVTVEAPDVQVDVPPAQVQLIGIEGPPGPQGPPGPTGSEETSRQGTCLPWGGDSHTSYSSLNLRVPEFPGSSEKVGREDTSDVFAVCHELRVPFDPTTGQPNGARAHSPLVIVKEMDKSTPGLNKALARGDNLADVTLDYYRVNPSDGTEVKFFTISLEDARVVSMDQVTLPRFNDRDSFQKYEEVSFVYEKIVWNWLPDSVVEQDLDPFFLQNIQGTKCSPVGGLFNLRVPEFPGSSEKVGREDTSDVFAVCHEFAQPFNVNGLASGAKQHSPLMILKEIDKSTPGLHKAIARGGQNVGDVTLDYYRINPSDGTEVKFFTITLRDARVVSVEQVTTEGIPSTDSVGNFEQVSFVYEEIEWNWLPDSVIELDTWLAPVP